MKAVLKDATGQDVAICTERVEAKNRQRIRSKNTSGCNLHGACGGKASALAAIFRVKNVAICTERVEAKQNMPKIARGNVRCNLHGACGGKDTNEDNEWR